MRSQVSLLCSWCAFPAGPPLNFWERWFSSEWTRQPVRGVFTITNNDCLSKCRRGQTKSHSSFRHATVYLLGVTQITRTVTRSYTVSWFFSPLRLTFFLYLGTKKCYRKEISTKGSWSQYPSREEEKVLPSFGDPKNGRAQDPREEPRKEAKNQRRGGEGKKLSLGEKRPQTDTEKARGQVLHYS